MHPRPKNTG